MKQGLLTGFLMATLAGVSSPVADPLDFVAVGLNPEPPEPEIVVLPTQGPRLIVRLPAELWNRTIDIFGAEGKAVCAVTARGIMKVEFNPLREEIVPGSIGVGSIWSLTVVKETKRIFVSGLDTSGGCGTFEIDPSAGTMRSVLTGRGPGHR